MPVGIITRGTKPSFDQVLASADLTGHSWRGCFGVMLRAVQGRPYADRSLLVRRTDDQILTKKYSSPLRTVLLFLQSIVLLECGALSLIWCPLNHRGETAMWRRTTRTREPSGVVTYVADLTTMVGSLSEGPGADRADRIGWLGSRSHEGKPSTVSTSEVTRNGVSRAIRASTFRPVPSIAS
jgi:hypothetical protein